MGGIASPLFDRDLTANGFTQVGCRRLDVQSIYDKHRGKANFLTDLKGSETLAKGFLDRIDLCRNPHGREGRKSKFRETGRGCNGLTKVLIRDGVQ